MSHNPINVDLKRIFKKILFVLLIGGIGVQTFAQNIVAVLEIIPSSDLQNTTGVEL
jgi:hypothetical protein